MHWQDIVLTSGQIVFTLALLPTVFGKDKPNVYTSLATSAFLFIFVFTYITMSLYSTAFFTSITAILWLILVYQKYKI